MGLIEFTKKHIGFILLFSSLIAGVFIFDDYGISWDEHGSHQIGTLNYEYIFSGNDALLTYSEKDYGIAFELPLIIIEKALGLNDSREIFLARHLITYLFFIGCAFICFRLIDFLYKNKWLAAIGFLLFLLNPLIFAHAFINSKDIPFMGMFIICFYLIAIAFNSLKIKHFVLLGLAAGLLINMRIVGILLVACVGFFMVMDLMDIKGSKPLLKSKLKLLSIFFITTLLTLYITWPYLWVAPIDNFLLALKRMSKYTWYGDVLFNGMEIRTTKISWYYLPVWFCITTPIIYLILGLFGILFISFNFFKKPINYLKNLPERNNILYLICFFTPILAAIILHSILYDGWRHMYFIYPSFVMMAIAGLNYIYKTKLKMIALVSIISAFCFSGVFMIRNHPFQHVFFNRLVDIHTPEYLRTHFELEYWGTSYKQSLEFILAHDTSPFIAIAIENVPGKYNIDILKPEDRNRIKLVEKEEADYFITNYRWHPQDYSEFKNKEFHTFKVGNNSINSIFKLK